MSEVRCDTLKEQVMVAVHDTVMETKTMTITKNEAGDTTFTSVVTDRLRTRNRDKIAKQTTKTVVKTDTVYVAVRDSLQVTAYSLGNNAPDGKPLSSSLLSCLKWVFGIIVSLIVLVLILKYRRFRLWQR